jgi:hypothetical protein
MDTFGFYAFQSPFGRNELYYSRYRCSSASLDYSSRAISDNIYFSFLPQTDNQASSLALAAAILFIAASCDISILGRIENPAWYFLPLHLFAFFVTSMVCHGELANSRPSPFHLTEFYLWLSVGGVLGGIFNALISPLIFNSLAEYPLILVLACFLRPQPDKNQVSQREHHKDLILPLILFGTFGSITLIVSAIGYESFFKWVKDSPNLALILITLFSSYTGVLLYSFRRRPLRFGFGVGGAMLVFTLWGGLENQVIHSERNFFGIIRVEKDPKAGLNLLFHGTTLHGAQSQLPNLRREPLTYFHRKGPLGKLFETFSNETKRNRIYVIGLGFGVIAAYAETGQYWVFYEIDPTIERIARDSRYFTFLNQCPAGVEVVLGDGRLSLAKAPNSQYDMIIVDAFSSDSIPMHLLTREAINLYLAKLAADGILAFHISNRYLNLQPVLANLAGDAGLLCFIQEDIAIGETEKRIHKTGSVWALMSRPATDLGLIYGDDKWKKVQPNQNQRVWTDDFSNILTVFMWTSSK